MFDTDSLTYEIKSENVYEEFFKWKDLIDFSNYPKDSKFFDEANIKVIELKSKMHSMKKKLMVKNVIQQK